MELYRRHCVFSSTAFNEITRHFNSLKECVCVIVCFSYAPGTVISGPDSYGHVRVRWDNGYTRGFYRVGDEGKYDLDLLGGMPIILMVSMCIDESIHSHEHSEWYF